MFTIAQREELKAGVARRKEIREELAKMRAERAALRDRCIELLAEMESIGSLNSKAKTYGVTPSCLYEAVKKQYKNLNPLDAQAAESHA